MSLRNVDWDSSLFDGAIFDLDGTLLDSSHVWSDVDVKFFSKRGLAVPDDYVQNIACLNFLDSAKYTAERFGLNEKPEDIAEEWFGMALYEYSNNVRLKDGAEELLRRLKNDGIKIALATACDRRLFTAALKNNGVYEYFDAFVTTEDVCRSKRYGDVYIYAAGKLGCRVSRCAVFEDLEEAISAASLCGFVVFDSK